ncbi:RcnB family protein [Phenylobacterium sp.]|jgi:Ni/Co efflux regulator RcnB|uniref:RcnB family protein n=1 Tax=Phenylobacterium sp. TaxID=1871053 RepID=UPI002E2F31EF|nr:RcnB family protein [Phenylobacterium sp.]HEX4713219.1 RcnB family protein [Phenylobacterium sp.]
MKTTLTALTLLLFAGAATAALAQEHEQDRGGDRPQVHQGAPGGGAGGGPPRQFAPQAAPPAGAAPGAPGAQAPGRTYEGRARFGAPPAPGAAPQIGPGGQRFQGGGPAGGQRWDRTGAPPAPGPGAAPQIGPGGQRFQGGGPADGQRFDRGGPGGDRRFQSGGGPREVTPPTDGRWDRSGAPPREVVPPQGGERGWNPRDGRQAGTADGRGGAQHWQRGRYPPVYWSQQRYRLGAYRAPYGYYSRAWGYGDFLPRGWFAQDYWLDDFLDLGLPYPPPGFEWVRVGGDALLVDHYSGRIVQVVRAIFW